MKLVSCYGGVWSLTDQKFKTLMEYIAAGGDNVLMDRWGRFVGFIEINVTDIDPAKVEEAKAALAMLKKK